MSENEQPKGEQRNYAVLYRRTETEPWTQTEEFVRAGASDEAIRKLIRGLGDAEINGFYVAIPERSFKPVWVEAKLTTQLKFGGD